MKNNIMIIVSNIAEDESYANGLWDLAAELAKAVAFARKEEIGEDEVVYPMEWGMEEIYNMLLEFAIYTHPEHENNRRLVDFDKYAEFCQDKDKLYNLPHYDYLFNYHEHNDHQVFFLQEK